MKPIGGVKLEHACASTEKALEIKSVWNGYVRDHVSSIEATRAS